MAGWSLRWARSPVPPKITSVVGWTGRRSRPSISGLGCCSTAATALLLRVGLRLGRRVGRPGGVAAELVAERRVHLRGECVLAPRREALEQRGGDHRRRDAPLDR